MARGLAYDSDEGRAYAGAITALMTGEAYHQSAIIARDHGWPFPGYAKNREPFLEVMQMHRDAVETINPEFVPDDMISSARKAWDDAIFTGVKNGYRNAQSTVLAPTGTIGFLMDCDTTGIEPDIAIVKYKSLVGGGVLKIVNGTVPEALRKLGYTPRQQDEIIAYIEKNDTIEGAPELKSEHLSVFDCAFKPANGDRSIHYMGHVKMMAAAQPFISGAISKCVTKDTLIFTDRESRRLAVSMTAKNRATLRPAISPWPRLTRRKRPICSITAAFGLPCASRLRTGELLREHRITALKSPMPPVMTGSDWTKLTKTIRSPFGLARRCGRRKTLRFTSNRQQCTAIKKPFNSRRKCRRNSVGSSDITFPKAI